MYGHDIKKIVEGYFEVPLNAKTRKLKVIRPRQIAMYLCRKYTKLSFAQIGNIFNKHHSTVMHNIDLVVEKYNELEDDILALEQILSGVSENGL